MTDAEVLEVQAMIERWASRLRRRAAKKGVALEDLKSSAWVAALKAAKTYDPALSRLTTHVYVPCNYAMLRELLAMGSPVTQPRDAYHLEPLHQAQSHEEHHATVTGEDAIQASEMLRRITDVAGPLADVIVEVLVGQKTLQKAAEEAGVELAEMRAFRDFVLDAVRTR